MKILSQILTRITLITTVVLTGWAVLFFFVFMDEVNDETDDMLEDYAEFIIRRALAGEQLPSVDNGSNNQYFIRPVSADYAATHSPIVYADSMVYIASEREHEAARILTYIFPDEKGCFFELSVFTPTIEKADLKRSILIGMICLYVVLLLFLISLTAWMVRRYTRRMEQAFSQQKLFIGNASHEMQTPIAICRNRLEMLMDDERLDEATLSELNKTYQTLDRMSRLNKSLLLLTKIDNGQFDDDKEVEVNALLKNYLSDYAEVYAHKRIALDLHEAGTLTWHIDESLAATLIVNLLKNAYVHNVEDGGIEIWVDAGTLSVANTARTAEPLSATRIFDRFYHDRSQSDSTGLGLSIVQAICQRYRFGLHYTYKEGMHRFEVKS